MSSTSTGHHSPTAAINWSKADLWGPPQRRRWTGGDIGWAVLALIVTNLLAAIPAFLLMTNPANSTSDIANHPLTLTAGLLALWVVFGGYPVYVTIAKGARSLAADFGWVITRRDVLIGLGAGLLLRGLDFLSSHVASRFIDMSDADNSSWLTMPRPVLWTIFFALGAAVIAPALEELFFRGFLMKTVARLRRIPPRFATAAGVIASSVLFGAMHVTAFNAGGYYVVAVTGTLGLIMALMTVWSRRLGPAVVTHVVFNTTGVLAAFLL